MGLFESYDADPDRFPEGFSLFIISGSLIGLWASGSLKIPKGKPADIAWILLVGVGVFGFCWACLGMYDRYTANSDE